MDVQSFIKQYKNHPVLFVGSGFSFRYLKQSYTWDKLLESLAFDLFDDEEYYLNLKSKYKSDFALIAQHLEDEYTNRLLEDRNGKFKRINDECISLLKEGKDISRFKIYIAEKLKNIEINNSDEISELKKVKKNIASIITTNYDLLCETLFEFHPLIGNDILMSNPYGSLYKIHGCVTSPGDIIITKNDYEKFNKKYELIRAQLLSIFIHNPIIFLGYSLSDENIREILKTIFSYIYPNSEQAKYIQKNFLLVEYEKDSKNQDVMEHDIILENNTVIRIHKLKTDDYGVLYRALGELQLPVSAMDIRKVQTVVKNITAGGNIQVKIMEDIEDLDNGDKILAIGSDRTVQYVYKNTSQVLANYFKIVDEENKQILDIIDSLPIQQNQYFPIFGFAKINNNISTVEKLQKMQSKKIDKIISEGENILNQKKYNLVSISIDLIKNDVQIPIGEKEKLIDYYVIKGDINIFDYKEYIIREESCKADKPYENTMYRKRLCVYDYVKFNKNNI